MKFFPTIAEIKEIIAKMPPEWYYQDFKQNKLTEKEKEELDSILEDLTREC